MHAPASLLSITNATSPIFGLAWAALFGDERVTLRKATGLGLGIAGVALIAQPAGAALDPLFGWAIAAALCGLLRLRARRPAHQALPGRCFAARHGGGQPARRRRGADPAAAAPAAARRAHARW